MPFLFLLLLIFLLFFYVLCVGVVLIVIKFPPLLFAFINLLHSGTSVQKQVCAAHCATRLSSSRCSLLLCTHSSSRANYIIRHFYFYSDFNFICLLPEREPEWGRGRESKCTAKSVLRLCSSAVDVIVVIIACCALTSLSGVASASVGVAAALPLSLSLFFLLCT